MKCRRLTTWKDEQGIEHTDVVWFGSIGRKSLFPKDMTFATATWKQIDDACKLGVHETYFKVGDQKTIFYDGQEVVCTIIDFAHDKLSNSIDKACITIAVEQTLGTSIWSLNGTGDSKKWSTSQLRSSMSDVFMKLPSDLRQYIVDVDKKTNTGTNDGNIETTSDKLFPLSLVECNLTSSYKPEVYAQEGEPYAYYVLGGSLYKEDYISKTKTNYWLRSPQPTSTSSYISGIESNADKTARQVAVSNSSSNTNISIAFCIGVTGLPVDYKTEFYNPNDKHDNFSDKQQAVVDSLTQRLSVIRRELWYDINYGLPLLDKQKSKVSIDAFIGKTVLAHPDVDSIKQFESNIVGKKYVCSMTISTIYGDIILTV